MSSNASTKSHRLTVFLHAVLFVLGFSLVFVIGWGGAATALGQLFGAYKSSLGLVGGVLVIVFGLATLRVLRIPWLYYDTRPQWGATQRGGWLASGLMGVFFAAGWTPCVGPILGAILFLAGTGETAGTGVLMLGAYSLGLGIPFFASALGLNAFLGFYGRFRTYLRMVEVAAGILLVVVGALLYTNYITVLNGYLIALTPQWLWERL